MNGVNVVALHIVNKPCFCLFCECHVHTSHLTASLLNSHSQQTQTQKHSTDMNIDSNLDCCTQDSMHTMADTLPCGLRTFIGIWILIQ